MSYKRDWTFEDLVSYFGGNRADAASQVCDKTIRYCLSSPNRSKYPLTPLNSPRSFPSRTSPLSSRVRSRIDPPTPYRQSRLSSETDPHLLDSSALAARLLNMSIRCNKCHRYLEGAPDPSLGHDGSAGDARCVLDHVPDPCDYVDKKGRRCKEYGEYDPDFVPGGKNLGAREKGDLTSLSVSEKPKELSEKEKDVIKELSDKNLRMEANLSDVNNSVGKLTDDMAKLMKMMATFTKTDPKPAASLSEPGHPSIAAAAAPTITPTQQPPPPTSAAPPLVTPASSTLAGRVENLVNSNHQSNPAKPTLDGYEGPTIPDLRKDQDLSEIVRTEVQRMIATQLPSLQKSLANTDQDYSYQQAKQQAVNQQQLADFRAEQKKQMEAFAANQEQQFLALQQQLGAPGQVGRPQKPAVVPARPAYVHPAATQSDHPAYTALQQGGGSNSNLAMDMENLMGLTVRNKQFRPYEFAARTQLFYAKNITERNCNFPCYVLGYLRHCLIIMSGVVPSSENELSSRLTNLMNICEIAANNSTLNDFDSSGWQIAKAYGDRVFHDVETGQKSWEDLPVNILADTFLHAKDTVTMKAKKTNVVGDKDPKNDKKKKKKSEDGKGKACTTYNTFRTGEGCAYEFNNSESKCVFEHYCRKCFAKNGQKETHKALNCEAVSTDKSE